MGIFNNILGKSLTKLQKKELAETLVASQKDGSLTTVLSDVATKGGTIGLPKSIIDVTTTGSGTLTHTIAKADYEAAAAGIPNGFTYMVKYKVGSVYGYSPIFMSVTSTANTLHFFYNGTYTTLTKGS